MRVIGQILKRDFLRLIKTPAAVIVMLFLMVLPSMYTWYNVVGFWDPYSNTGNLKVAVVNEDAGGSSDITGELHVGDSVIDALKENTQLNWVFCSYDDGMAALEAGDIYAMFVIPQNFTENLLSITTGTFVKPSIVYYVNEKTGPVAPKITNAGATTLETTINSTFVETVSNAIVSVLKTSIEQSDLYTGKIQGDLAQKIRDTRTTIQETRDALSVLNEGTTEMRQAISDAKGALGVGKQVLGDMETQLDDVDEQVKAVDSSLDDVNTRITASLDYINQAAQDLVAQYGEDDPTAAQLAQLAATLTASAKGLADVTNTGFHNALAQLSSAGDTLQLTLDVQDAALGQAVATLNELDSTTSTLQSALSSTDTALADVDSVLASLYAAVITATSSDTLAQMISETGLDLTKVSSFLGSPTTVTTEQLYPLNAYGSAMAPLFMNLTFWIGAFMLVVILRVESDSEGLKHANAQQLYLGRYIFMCIIAIIQALICVAGCVYLGVQTVDKAALYFAAAFTSFTYMSIIYFLSITLRHIGKAICIFLVFVQIPGGTGLYPVEMTSSFFQGFYPLLPFTYGVRAMREGIFGFYGDTYIHALFILFLFATLCTLAGLLLYPAMANVNKLFAREIQESGEYNDEMVFGGRDMSRYERIFRSMTPEEVEELRQRAAKADRIWPRFVRVGIILSAAIPVILAGVFVLSTAEKATILTIWLVSMIVLCIVLIVVENWRTNATGAFAYILGKAPKLPDGTGQFAAEGAGAQMTITVPGQLSWAGTQDTPADTATSAGVASDGHVEAPASAPMSEGAGSAQEARGSATFQDDEPINEPAYPRSNKHLGLYERAESDNTVNAFAVSPGHYARLHPGYVTLLADNSASAEASNGRAAADDAAARDDMAPGNPQSDTSTGTGEEGERHA